MKETLDDLVFENRNKDYGAYYLRSNYKSYLTRATVVGSSIFVLLIGSSFVFNKIQQSIQEKKHFVDLTPTELDPVKEKEVIELPEEVPPVLDEPVVEMSQEKFLPPEPMKDESVTLEEPPPTYEKLETAAISSTTVEGVDVITAFTPPPKIKAVEDVKVEVTKEEEVFVGVEQSPEFPGGEKAMYKFLGDKIQYPAAASRANISGRVTVQFVVEKDGSIGSLKVLKSLGFGCDEEALRVIKSMPKWNAGKQNGKAVRVYFTLPIMFTLTE